MNNNFYEEVFRREHMRYDRIITDGMNHIKEYIDDLVNISEKYSDIYNDLCTKNNIDKNTVKKSNSILEFEAKLKESYIIARNYYDELGKMKEDNLSGICVEPDVRNLFERFNNERLPIIEDISIKLCPTKEQDTQQQETGFAADVKEIQFPINSVRSQNAPTIAGVERKEPKNFEDAADIIVEEKYKNFDRKTKNQHSLGSSTNPNYSKGGGYHRNCQVCVAVFEARMRGYNIEALPFNTLNTAMQKLRRNPEKAFIDKKTNLPPELIYDEGVTDYSILRKWLNTIIKPSERYGLICKIVLTSKGQDLYDHILIAYKTEQGELRFYDPQNGVEVEHFGNIRFNYKNKIRFYPKIFRTDNADLNIDYLNKIAK